MQVSCATDRSGKVLASSQRILWKLEEKDGWEAIGSFPWARFLGDFFPAENSRYSATTFLS